MSARKGRERVLGVRPAILILVLAAMAALAALALWRPWTASPSPVGLGVQELPSSVPPAFTPAEPRRLARSRTASYWAPLHIPVTARAAPRADAPVVARLGTRTPEGTTSIVLVLGRAEDAAGRLWIRARLPVLEHGGTGWLPRAALGGYHAVRTRLWIELGRLRATLFRDGRPIFRAVVGVGKSQWPTPRGQFFVRNRITSFASPTYGPIAFGTSARSRVLTDWPAGGYVGIHGTDRPDLLPGRVSHGCIRMQNRDILELARLMPVGTPITIS